MGLLVLILIGIVIGIALTILAEKIDADSVGVIGAVFIMIAGLILLGAFCNGTIGMMVKPGEIGEWEAFLAANHDQITDYVHDVHAEAPLQDRIYDGALVDLPNMQHSAINAEARKLLWEQVNEYNKWLGASRARKRSFAVGLWCWWDIPEEMRYIKVPQPITTK